MNNFWLDTPFNQYSHLTNKVINNKLIDSDL